MDADISSKTALRALMRNKRSALQSDLKKIADREINSKLSLILSNLSEPAVVAAYVPTPAEVDVLPFVQKCINSGAAVAVPRWNGFAYDLAVLSGVERSHLEVGPMGILQPPQTALKVSPSDIGLWIVPALSYTCSGRRLGYGGGWYDRMLSAADDRSVKIGVAYSFQVLAEIPHDEHDESVAFVVASDSV